MSTKAGSFSSRESFRQTGNYRRSYNNTLREKIAGTDSYTTIIYTALTWFIVLGGPLLILNANVGPKQKMIWLFVWPLFLAIWMSGFFMGFRFDIEPFTVLMSFFMGAAMFLVFSAGKGDEQMAEDIANGNMVIWAATYAFLILCADLGRKFYNQSLITSAKKFQV